jgi:hypothetical protein
MTALELCQTYAHIDLSFYIESCIDDILFVFHFISEFEEMISFLCFRLIEINVYKDF